MLKSFSLVALALSFLLHFPVESRAQIQVATQAEIRAFKELLPAVAESSIIEDIEKRLHSDDMIWYTKKSMPPAYQVGNGFQGNIGPLHLGDANINISRDFPGEGEKANGKGGNANIDFPWGQAPGGTMASDLVRDYKGMLLPRVTAKQAEKYNLKEGDFWPIVVTVEDYPDAFFNSYPPPQGRGFDRGITWAFPVDTMFVEVITQHYKGMDFVFEIRIRYREPGEWAVDIFRPFSSPKELANKIKKLRPDWRGQSNLRSLVADLENSGKLLSEARLKDNHVGGERAFDERSKVDVLPPINDDRLAMELLVNSAFGSTLGYNWRKGAVAPTTDSDTLHIVPKNYDGAFLGGDRQSCMECHKHAGMEARRFDPQRGWYGYVRGSPSEAILSMHPFEPSFYTGKMRSEEPLVRQRFGGIRDINENSLRKAWVREGIIQLYDRQKHPVAVYHSGVPNNQ